MNKDPIRGELLELGSESVLFEGIATVVAGDGEGADTFAAEHTVVQFTRESVSVSAPTNEKDGFAWADVASVKRDGQSLIVTVTLREASCFYVFAFQDEQRAIEAEAATIGLYQPSDVFTVVAASTTTTTCPYCAEPVQPAAVVCKHCHKNIGPGHNLEAAGQAMQSFGCGMMILFTVPALFVIVLMVAC